MIKPLQMKRLLIALAGILVLWSCKPKQHDADMYPYDLMKTDQATLLLYEGDNTFQTDHFFDADTQIDSIGYSRPGCLQVSDDKRSFTLTCDFETLPWLSELTFYIQGHHYSVLCKKASLTRTAFEFEVPSGVSYNKVFLHGNFGRYSDSVEMNFEGKRWQKHLYLEPGDYTYYYRGDGKILLPSDTDTSNGLARLTISDSYEKTATIRLKKYDKNTITISASQEIDEYFIFWQGYRIPPDLSGLEAMDYSFIIPAAAAKLNTSSIRIIAFNQQGITNDLLIPLINGAVANNKSTGLESYNHLLLCFDKDSKGGIADSLTIDNLCNSTGFNTIFISDENLPANFDPLSACIDDNLNTIYSLCFASQKTSGYRRLLGNCNNNLIFDHQLFNYAYSCFDNDSLSFGILATAMRKTLRKHGYQHRLANLLPTPVQWINAVRNPDTKAYDKLCQLTVFSMCIPGIPALLIGNELIKDIDGKTMVFIPQRMAAELKTISAIRTENPALQVGDFNILESVNFGFAFQRSYFDNVVVVAFNKSDFQQIIGLNLVDVPAGLQFTDYFGSMIKQSDNYVRLDMPPHSFEIITTNQK